MFLYSRSFLPVIFDIFFRSSLTTLDFSGVEHMYICLYKQMHLQPHSCIHLHKNMMVKCIIHIVGKSSVLYFRNASLRCLAYLKKYICYTPMVHNAAAMVAYLPILWGLLLSMGAVLFIVTTIFFILEVRRPILPVRSRLRLSQ